jgi:hypothetical protein
MLLLVQLTGLIVPFVMLHALYAPPGFLQSAAAGAAVIRWAVLLLLANGALSTGISVFVHPDIRPTGRGLAQWIIVLGAIWIALQAVDNTHVTAMVSLSQHYTDSAGAARATFESLGPVTAATRRAAHYSVLLAIGAWMLLFYAALWRSRLVARVLPAFGVLAAALHIAGVSLPVFVGYPGVLQMGMVLAASHGALILWLLARGFAERPAT